MPKPAYYIFTRRDPEESLQEIMDDLLRVFPAILHSEDFHGRTHIHVQCSSESQVLTEEQLEVVSKYQQASYETFYQWYEPGEKEAIEEQHQREEKERYEQERLVQQEGARYFVCEFVQNASPGFGSDLYVQSVQPGAYTTYPQAQQAAKSIEQSLYRKRQYGSQVEARLARNREEAQQGIFLDG